MSHGNGPPGRRLFLRVLIAAAAVLAAARLPWRPGARGRETADEGTPRKGWREARHWRRI